MAWRLLGIVALMVATISPRPTLGGQDQLIAETTATQYGLARPWFAQVQLDKSRAQLDGIVLYEGVLYAYTNAAGIHALDAETGKTLWTRQVGDVQQPTMPPALSHKLMAVVNGSRLFILDRLTGELLYDHMLNGAPGSGPAISDQWVFIPMSHGLMYAYYVAPAVGPPMDRDVQKLKTEFPDPQSQEETGRHLRIDPTTKHALTCQAFGQCFVPPLVTRQNDDEEYVLWPTERGYLNLARIERKDPDALRLVYRMSAGRAIVAQPFFLPPDPKVTGDAGLIAVASRDGFIYLLDHKTGDIQWRFSTGEAINESPVILENHVYSCTHSEGMYCLDLKDGQKRWFAPNAVHFVARSKERVYAADSAGRLLVLRADSGVLLDTFDVSGLSIKLANTDTDRIYLATRTGLIQCLHEAELTDPLIHNKDRKVADPSDENSNSTPKDSDDSEPSAQESNAPTEHFAAGNKPAATKEKPRRL